MLRSFAHPTACCCVLVGVNAQTLKPVKLLARANGRNSVGQQLLILMVGCYILRLFAHPVAGQKFSPVQTDAALLAVVTSVCT